MYVGLVETIGRCDFAVIQSAKAEYFKSIQINFLIECSGEVYICFSSTGSSVVWWPGD